MRLRFLLWLMDVAHALRWQRGYRWALRKAARAITWEPGAELGREEPF